MTNTTTPEDDEVALQAALAGMGQLAGFVKAIRSAEAVLGGLTLARQAKAETDAALAKIKEELVQSTDELSRRRAAGRKLPDAETDLAAKVAEIEAVEAELARKHGELAAVQAQITEANDELANRQANIRELAARVAALAGGAV